MKIFNVLLVGLAALIGYVAANGASLGYEIVQFYYVYKMEFLSNIAEGDRRLGLACTKAHGRMCYFDEFALSILADGPLKQYFQTNWAGRTHTLTPDDTAASAISNNANNDDTIDVDKLSSTFPANGEPVPYAKVVEDVTDVAQKAADAGGGDLAKTDVDSAASYATKARKVRADDAYLFVRNLIQNALGSAGRQYFVFDNRGKTFNWRATFTNINNAAASGALNSNQANTFKRLIRDAANGILRNTSLTNIRHWAAVKSFSTFISKVSAVSANLASSAQPPPAAGGGAACSSEFSAGGSGAAAARKRRRQILEQAIASARQTVQLDPLLSAFADGGVVVVDGVVAY